MGKTIAQTLIEEGKELGIRECKELGIVQAKQEVLTKLLRSKFGDNAQDIVEKVKAIQNINELDTLFDRALAAKTVEELQDI